MMLDLKKSRKKLNAAARTTADSDVLLREIADRLVERLPLMRLQPKRLLECGAKSGYMTQQLRQFYPNTEIIAVDYTDQQLLQIPNAACAKAASYYSALPFQDNSFDMIVSSLALHWTNDLAVCFRECQRVLKPNGLFIFTLLGVETLKELRDSFSECHEYLHRFPDMHDVGDLLIQSGLGDPVMEMENITIRYKSLNTLFNDFKNTGMGNAHQKRPRGLFGKQRWQKALSHYETLKQDQAYPATFEIIYGHAWCSEIDYKQMHETIVSVDKIIIGNS